MHHTASLEIAKKLKEAGRDKKCEYIRVETSRFGIEVYNRAQEFNLTQFESVQLLFDAPLATEILDALPQYIEPEPSNEYGYTVLQIEASGGRRCCFYCDLRDSNNLCKIIAYNLCDALAELWIRCKKHGYLSSTKE